MFHVLLFNLSYVMKLIKQLSEKTLLWKHFWHLELNKDTLLKLKTKFGHSLLLYCWGTRPYKKWRASLSEPFFVFFFVDDVASRLSASGAPRRFSSDLGFPPQVVGPFVDRGASSRCCLGFPLRLSVIPVRWGRGSLINCRDSMVLLLWRWTAGYLCFKPRLERTWNL